MNHRMIKISDANRNHSNFSLEIKSSCFIMWLQIISSCLYLQFRYHRDWFIWNSEIIRARNLKLTFGEEQNQTKWIWISHTGIRKVSQFEHSYPMLKVDALLKDMKIFCDNVVIPMVFLGVFISSKSACVVPKWQVLWIYYSILKGWTSPTGTTFLERKPIKSKLREFKKWRQVI